MKDQLLYQIGLTLINGIGDINAKNLLAYCGSAEQVFKQKKTVLLKVPGIGETLAKSIVSSTNLLKRAEEEINFIDKYKIAALFFNLVAIEFFMGTNIAHLYFCRFAC